VIRVELEGRVRVITLDRAEKRNALTPEMLEELRAAVAADAVEAAALLLRGDGPVFCSGFDLGRCKYDDPTQPTMRRYLVLLHEAIGAMRDQPRPIVLCAAGAAIAGGCALLGGADIVVADADTKIGYPVTPLGISPAVSAPFLARDAGAGAARARLLDGGLISGERAAELGIIHELERDVEAAHARATQLAAKPMRAVRDTKRWLDEVAPVMKAEKSLETSVNQAGTGEAIERLDMLWNKP
jgi:enoyl-CoA hydratase/carnithine racemase